MKLGLLEAQDFRSFQKVRWELGDLNVLIGPNGSGKTNLVILLKLIAQSAQGKLSSAILRLGGIGPLLCDHKADGFSFLLKSTSNGVKPEKSHLSVTYKCELLRKGKEGSYQIQVERLQQVPHRNGAKEPDAVDVLARRGPNAQLLSKNAAWIKLARESIPSEETLLASCGGPIPQYPTLASFQRYLSSWSITIRFASMPRPWCASLSCHATPRESNRAGRT